VTPSGQVFKMLPTSSASNVYHNPNYGPTWGGGHDLHINNNMDNTSSYTTPSTFKRAAPGFPAFVEKTSFCGSHQFAVDELEVFRVSLHIFGR